MTAAKKAVDSTLRKILTYTAEIIMSIILLIVLCIPLAFGIPMWFQKAVFGASESELLINPFAWFGGSGAFWVTLLLTVVSVFVAYLLVYRLIPSTPSDEEEVEAEYEEEEDEGEEEETEDEPEFIEESDEEPIDADASNEDEDSEEAAFESD
ncbi:MAG: hypothetical protein ACFFD6_10425 [Candidatus Thorarchaeota archaeon]